MSQNETTAPARWWHSGPDGTIHCHLCPRHCNLREGQVGFCRVRKVEGGALKTFVYGKTSGFRVDPVEKKPLYHFLPGTETLSFGTACCNMGCIFCQNWQMSSGPPEEILTVEATPDEVVHAALENGCSSVSFTYNDPVIFAEYSIDTAEVCHRHGLRTIAVTAGYIEAEARSDFFSHMDAANVDLKGFTEEFYRRYCKASLSPVLETLKYLANETGVWLEITNLLIPGANDSQSSIDSMTRWIREHLGSNIPLFFSAFHPDFRLRDRGPTPPDTLQQARDIALSNGLRYVYTSNLGRKSGANTHCHKCRALLIERSGFRVVQNHLDGNRCHECGEVLPGVFSP